ncbi:PREDICTED: uncharacterized protein LOC108612256 [Drosophila arizonae]|uniref:Uncharacterized protein LOC108612256 n=1 Tax=Drosophila arizonae TaxID=7263 RepID=A0ABM1P086_DROAR|nr:PREDICTED: uncharacterized protein LOC108612256 [Drosophila arizonae]
MLRVLLLLLLALGVLDCRADCNVCSTLSNAACVSQTQFMFCVNNILVQPVNSCPSGTFCTAQAAICQSNSSLVSCTECGICSDNLVFACLGVHTYALCLGTQQPSQITGSCAPYLVCNRNNPNICGSALTEGQASCPLMDNELYIDANTYCRSVQRAGRYPYGNRLETTCKQYVNCYVYNTIWYGALYECPGSTYFQPSSQMCNTTVPSACRTTASSLQWP